MNTIRTILMQTASLCTVLLITASLCCPPQVYSQTPPGAQSDNSSIRSWRLALGASIIGSPMAQTGSVAAVCDDNSLRVASQEGRLLWSFRDRRPLLPWLTRSREGTNYVGTRNGELLAINRAGKLIWRLDLADPLTQAPIIGFDGRLFVPTRNRLRAVSAAGRLLWSRELPGPIENMTFEPNRGGLLASSGRALIHLSPWGHLSSIDAGRTIKAISGAEAIEGIEGIEGREGVDGWTAVAALDNGTIVRVQGDRIQPFASVTASREVSAIAVQEGRVYVLLRDGYLSALALSNGELAWQEKTLAIGEAKLMVDERGIYCLGRTGSSAYTREGTRLWNLRLSDSPALAAFSDDGYVYSGGKDWVLYAYRAEDRLKSDRNALFARALDASYGLDRVDTLDEVDTFLISRDSGIQMILKESEEALLNGGIADKESETAALLLAIALSGSNPASAQPRQEGAVLPPQRVRALEILGRFASPEQIPLFIRIFRNDRDSHVRAMAAYTIGICGVDPSGRALAAFEAAAINGRDRQDEMLMISVAKATGALCRFSGPPLSERGIRLLTLLSGPDRQPVLQRTARAEIELFRMTAQ